MRTPILCSLVVALGAGLASAGGQTPSSAADAQKLLYLEERDQVLKAKAHERFAPGLLEKADAFAKKGEAARAQGRAAQAVAAFRQARWQLPYLPPRFPEHVGLILGNLRLRHSRPITAIAYAPGARALATSSNDGTIKIWDLDNGRERLRYGEHGAPVVAIVFSPDGSLVFSAGRSATVKVWDAQTGATRQTLSLPEDTEQVSALALSADGKYLLVGQVQNKKNPQEPMATAALLVYDVESQKLLRKISEFRGQVTAITFNPSQTLVAVGDQSGTCRAWAYPSMVKNAAAIAHWAQQDEGGAVQFLAYTPDGQFLLRGGDNELKFYLAYKPGDANVAPAPARTAPVASAQAAGLFSKDGKKLITGGLDGLVRIWDLEALREEQVLKRLGAGAVSALALHPDGSQLASSHSDCQVHLWEFDEVLQSRDLAGHEAPAWSTSFSPDGTRIVSASADQTLRVWEADTGRQVFSKGDHQAAVTVAAFSPDGKHLVSGGGDRTLRLWDASSGELLAKGEGHTGTIVALDVSRDGKRVVTSGADKRIKIWDASTARLLQSFDENPAVAAAVVFAPDGKTLALGCIDQQIRILDAATGQTKHRWTAHGNAVTCLAYAGNGQLLASGGVDRRVVLWSLAQDAPGTLLAQAVAHAGPVSAVAFRKDSQHIASAGSDQLVKVWKLENTELKEVQSFRGHRDWVTSVAFSADGYRLVSSGVDRMVKVWEITSREIPVLPEHSAAVNALAFSPDNKLLATGSGDHTIRLWDRATGAERGVLTGHTSEVTSLAFTPDSATLVSSGLEAAIRLWDPVNVRALPMTAAQRQSMQHLPRYSPYIAMHPDGKQLLVWIPVNEGPITTQVEAFDLRNGVSLFSFNDTGRKVNSLAFCANGKLAATGARDGSVRFWDLEKRGQTLPGGDFFPFAKKKDKAAVGIADLAITTDGTQLIVTNDEGEVCIARIAPRMAVTTFKAHDSRIVACMVSNDGKRFATVGENNSVKLWDMQGKELRSWDLGTSTHGLSVSAIVFAPNDRHLACANANSTAYLLELPPAE